MSINYSKVKSYRLYLNYDNDKQVYILPVLPEELQITFKGETSSATVDKFGEVLHKGKRDAAVIKFESFFPAKYDKFVCSCPEGNFKGPAAWHKWLKKLEEADKPAHLVLTKSPLSVNIYVDVTSYQPKEVGGDPGTIYFTLEMKEHREPVIRTIKKASSKKKTSKSPKKKRTSNKESKNKFKVTASALNLRTGPNARIIAVMPRGTVLTSDGKKNGNWYHVLYKKKWGYAYKSYLKKV